MRLTLKHLLRALVVCVCAASSVRADDPSKPYTRISIDLNSGGIEQTLPFDIPFYFNGTADQNVKRFTAVLVDGTASGGVCHEAAKPSMKAVTMTWLHRDGAPFDFVVFEPTPLDYNRNYCLGVQIVRSMSDANRKTYVQDATARVDTLIQAIPGRGDITVPQAERIRQSIIAALRDPNTGDTLSVVPGSIFQTQGLSPADERDLQSRFQTYLRDVKQEQDARAADIQNLVGLMANPVALTSMWHDSYQAVFDRLNALAPANALVESVLTQRRQKVSDYLALNGSALSRAFDGTADSSAPPLDTIWNAADIDTRVAAVQATVDRLKAAHDVLSIMLSDAPHRAALTAAEQGAAQALLMPVDQTRALTEGIVAVLTDLSGILQKRKRALTSVGDQLGSDLQENVTIVATTVGNFATRSAWYISADLGLVIVPSMEAATPYAGANIYLRPVNKNAPLSGATNSFGRRASLMVGITVGGDLTKTGERTNLFGDRMLLTGGGIRINDSLRLAGGAIWFKALDPNPLVDHPRVKWSWFISASIDWDVKGTFTTLGSTK